jgi:hypothetical protein
MAPDAKAGDRILFRGIPAASEAEDEEHLILREDTPWACSKDKREQITQLLRKI